MLHNLQPALRDLIFPPDTFIPTAEVLDFFLNRFFPQTSNGFVQE